MAATRHPVEGVGERSSLQRSPTGPSAADAQGVHGASRGDRSRGHSSPRNQKKDRAALRRRGLSLLTDGQKPVRCFLYVSRDRADSGERLRASAPAPSRVVVLCAPDGWTVGWNPCPRSHPGSRRPLCDEAPRRLWGGCAQAGAARRRSSASLRALPRRRAPPRTLRTLPPPEHEQALPACSM